jgi:hypothetical protein
MSNTTPREYELVNAAVAEEIELQEEEDGVWMHMTVAPSAGKARRRRRRTIFALILCALVVLIVVFFGGKRKNIDKESSAATTEATSSPNVVAPPPPTAAKTKPSSDASTPTLAAKYNCDGDRFQHGAKLKTNHFLCDHYNRYRFGMDIDGNFVFADDAFNMTSYFYNGTKGDYFELLVDGSFTVFNNSGDVVWKEKCDDDVSFSAECLPTHQETYDCPYLHLHSGGTIVLNWINHEGDWKERNILHMYNLPKCHDQFFCYP